MQVQLKFETPQTLEEIAPFRADLDFLHHFLPFQITEEEQAAVVASYVPNITIVYGNKTLVGFFALDVYKKSVELHGVVRPDLQKYFINHKKLKRFIFDTIISHLFVPPTPNKPPKQKIIIKGKPEWRSVRGFALMYGFSKLNNTEKGKNIYVLHRDKYLEGINNGARQAG